ncbi:hypothetical protein V492_00192 [Pseudogymnoascus sp. VKM F-4246]|nr:hypothetical protein V492_00192 [Pseudogymnoascus sp. VKM F-4246]
MASCPQYNCTALFISPPDLEPNPDVSGIGVLVGFLATAYLVVCLLIVHYVLVFNPAEAGLAKETCYMVLMMSDQQMVTGTALLLSATTQLKCGISAYHWQTMIYFVWFSSFTHLATLTVLRGYLYENPSMRLWRLFFMTILILLLIAALTPTGNVNWDVGSVPASCFFRYSLTSNISDNLTSMIFSVLVLWISYTTRAIKLFERSSRLHVSLQNAGAHRWILSIPYYVILSTLLVVRSWLDLLESMFWEITWLLIALIWGTLRLFAIRNNTIKENDWGFGQCLATAMIVLLLFSAVETYIETKQKTREDTSGLAGSKPSTIRVDHDIVDENRSSQSSHHTARDRNQMLVDDLSETEGSTEADISDHALIATGTDELPWRLPRSTTILSAEERSLGTSIHQLPRGSQSEIELADMSQAYGSLATDTLEPRILPAHERNYYTDRWYISLVVFNFIQIITPSIFAALFSTWGSPQTGE